MLEMERVVALVDNPRATILEIGANNGFHSDEFLRGFPQGKVYAFEPDPRAIKKLKDRAFDGRFSLIEKAVGKETGKITFFQSSGSPQDEDWPEGWDLSGSIKKPKGHLELHPWCKFETEISVDVIRLDDWYGESGIGVVDFIWADVQGAEEDMIQGAMNTLSNSRYFYTEYSNEELYEGEINLKQILDSLPAFEIVEVFDNDVLLKHKDL